MFLTQNSEYSETQNPFFELQNYTDMSPLVILDPSFYMIKNIAQNAHRIGEIQQQFYQAFLKLNELKENFMNELHNQLKTEIGVKKDYFLNYFRVAQTTNGQDEGKILDLENNIFEEVLCLKPLDPLANQTDTSEDDSNFQFDGTIDADPDVEEIVSENTDCPLEEAKMINLNGL